jgi:hypothetical protein
MSEMTTTTNVKTWPTTTLKVRSGVRAGGGVKPIGPGPGPIG